MSDRGLQEAIRAAGGVTELARRIGVTQPSVSNWRRVPAERVLAVEEVTGVKPVSLHHDISTATGEEVVLFTLAESPLLRDAKKR